MGTPCTPWTVSCRRPSNHDRLRSHSLHATLDIIKCADRNDVFWSVENPLSSGLFRCPQIVEIEKRNDVFSSVFDMCAYGAHYKKPTKVLGTLPSLPQLSMLCPGSHYHDRLQGTVLVAGKHVWATKLAGAYPPPLCRAWAQAAKGVAPKSALSSSSHGSSSGRKWQACLLQGKKPDARYTVPTCPTRSIREWPE